MMQNGGKGCNLKAVVFPFHEDEIPGLLFPALLPSSEEGHKIR
jgi:hypothetical protein